MLQELHIRDIALIKDAWIEPSAGFTVFTGETGAGKTVLLNALKLIVGERGDLSLIRHGAESARIEAQFSGDVLATRQLLATGRNRCTLGDELVTVGRLAETLGPTIDLHGQHDHQALLRPATHARLLDLWGGEAIAVHLEVYGAAFDRYRQATAHLEELTAQVDKSVEEIETGRIALAEIERVDPVAGEDDALAEALPALQHAGELNEAIYGALYSLREEHGALDGIGSARDTLLPVTQYDKRLEEVVQMLSRTLIDIDEASLALRAIKETLQHNDVQLENTLSRLGALDGLKKRFGPSLDAVIERREHLTKLLALTENSDEELSQARAQLDQAHTDLVGAANVLHEVRSKTADELSKELRSGVISLDMEDAHFEVECELLPFENYTCSGPDRIEILYRPAPNATLRPLAKIASGGEISRVMLALKSVLRDTEGARTLVFDEIDAGIGGATATLVGRRLAHLARTHQVIVVTHLAQVAVFADTHYVVNKASDSGEVTTTVSLLEGQEREKEIARMLSGDTGAVARGHARELFENATL